MFSVICQFGKPHRIFTLIILPCRYASNLRFHVKLVAVHDAADWFNYSIATIYWEWTFMWIYALIIIVHHSWKGRIVYEEAIFLFTELVKAWVRCLNLIIGKKITKNLVRVVFVKIIFNIKSYHIFIKWNPCNLNILYNCHEFYIFFYNLYLFIIKSYNKML